MPAIFRLHLGDILFVKAAKGLNCFLAFSAQQSATRIGLGDKISTPDVFSHLIRANRKTASEESKIMFSPEDLMGEASLLIIAGNLFVSFHQL
jgi:hypothetical protein